MAIYLPNGRVSIQFMKRDRPRFTSGDAWRGTLEEERAAFEGYFAYAGRYTLDVQRSTVTHHLEISSAPNYVGTDLQRTFTHRRQSPDAHDAAANAGRPDLNLDLDLGTGRIDPLQRGSPTIR